MEVFQCNKKMEGKSTCIRIYSIYEGPYEKSKLYSVRNIYIGL